MTTTIGAKHLAEIRKDALRLRINGSLVTERYEVIQRVCDYLPSDHPLQPDNYDGLLDEDWALKVGGWIEHNKIQRRQDEFPEMETLLDKEVIGVEDLSASDLPDDYGFDGLEGPSSLSEWNAMAFAVADKLNEAESGTDEAGQADVYPEANEVSE